MRRYADPIEVRKGMVRGTRGPVEGPEQFLWRGRLWKVRDVVAQWVETGPWWQSADVEGVLGLDQREDDASPVGSVHDLLSEREVWRVEAGVGNQGQGVFDLAFDWSDGSWQLTGCVD